MKLLDLTLATAAENVALDEALLEQAERGDSGEVLRLWEPTEPMVVIGRSSRIRDEVDLEACAADGVDVIRRATGGLAVVSGPGCLMYGVVLDLEARPELRMIDQAHCYVLKRVLDAVRGLGLDAVCQGHSDLTLGDRKFSGNSLRIRRRSLLYHGTLLYDFALPLISRYLKQPGRQPDYRRNREHDAFVANLAADASSLRDSLKSAWEAQDTLEPWPTEIVQQLITERFGQEAWTMRQ